jgi:hypothetical protein
MCLIDIEAVFEKFVNFLPLELKEDTMNLE